MGKRKVKSAPPRPVIDDAVIQSGIIEFCKHRKGYKPEHLLAIYSESDDGYQLSRALENLGYVPSEETVTEISELDSYVHDALIVAEKRWVKENKITLYLQPGQQVKFRRANVECTGVISGIDAIRALYYVSRDRDPDKTRQCMLPVEAVTLLSGCSKEQSAEPYPCPVCGLGPCLTGEAPQGA